MNQSQWDMVITIFSIIAGVSGSNLIIYWSLNKRIDDFKKEILDKLNFKFEGVNKEFDGLHKVMDARFEAIQQSILRVEGVLDARLKHLEER